MVSMYRSQSVSFRGAVSMQPRRDGSGFSEEFAWEAREFLRKLAVGRVRQARLRNLCARWAYAYVLEPELCLITERALG